MSKLQGKVSFRLKTTEDQSPLGSLESLFPAKQADCITTNIYEAGWPAVPLVIMWERTSVTVGTHRLGGSRHPAPHLSPLPYLLHILLMSSGSQPWLGSPSVCRDRTRESSCRLLGTHDRQGLSWNLCSLSHFYFVINQSIQKCPSSFHCHGYKE